MPCVVTPPWSVCVVTLPWSVWSRNHGLCGPLTMVCVVTSPWCVYDHLTMGCVCGSAVVLSCHES